MTGKGFNDREKKIINTMALELRHAVLQSQAAGKEPDWRGLTGLICALWDFRDATPEDMKRVIEEVEKEAQELKKRREAEEATLNRMLADLKAGRA